MIYGIADLHLDYSKEKPMDIFGGKWINHEEKIFDNWIRLIKDEDLVLLPGDISWALRLEGAYNDLQRIDKLPGKKIILKGNHDYWWQGLKKLNGLNLKTIFFLQNNSYIYYNTAIVGTRGWIPKDSEDFDDQDKKIYFRELNRLQLSLESVKGNVDKIIAIMHYPPFNIDLTTNEFVSLMKEYNVEICLYGHLHSEGHRYAVEGNIEGIDFYCISSDYIDFIPKKIV
ncbi:metallophosphoesterase [Tissierella sp. MSJ-40]|uniref:Metallophosphoesterase n=1 Tax=Tissierella simiarum TaxID=2841534 RepID=A0ABS6E7Q7_9FIRM|nr:metallophosphoesterase [Tissierella simiarum]MBU5438945.1 metallophosphoesterase [Tissierella simiarum]